MATAVRTRLRGPAGVRIYGGFWPPGSISLRGDAVLDGPGAAGGLGQSALSGGAALGGPAAGGGLADAGPSALSGGAALAGLDAGGSMGDAPAGLADLTLSTTTTQTAPFAIGHTFKRGDVPSGAGIVVSGANANAQVTVLNRWPDNSVKFAIIAGTADTTAAGVALTLASGTTASGTALTIAQLKAALTQPVTVDAGAFGSASWSGADWDTPFRTWVSGHRMSSWVYRKQIGADAHLVAWLEVRYYAGGQVEILPWVENGYLTVAGPTSKSATYSFTMGGTQRFSAAIALLNHQRTPLVSGAAVSHWLGADPDVTVKHNSAYLQSTRLVPYYSAVVPTNAAQVTTQPTTFTPLQQGTFPNGMGAGGYSPSIGILPEWDVLYLTCSLPSLWKTVQFQGYSAGRYGIHFRDQATNLPLRFSQHPNLCMDGTSNVTNTGVSSTNTYVPAATGTVPPAYTNTHAPAMGYMAYLATGRYFHLETAQFEACVNYLKQANLQRNGSEGVFQTQVGANTTRGAAWAIRTLAQAAAITPDGDVLRTEFLTSLGKNVEHYHGRYIVTANCPYGIVEPYSDYTFGTGDNIYYEATWMQDFFTAAIGCAKSLNLPLTTTQLTQLDEFFAWKAQSVVNRFQGVGSTEFLYRDAAPYVLAIAPSDSPNFTTGAGPWYANWGQIYDATYNGSIPQNTPTGGLARVEGNLRGPNPSMVGEFPDATATWGELQPALAYAVEHKVAGALTAYSRMTQAANWPQIASSWNANPVWSVKPPPELTAVPAWRSGQAVNTWREIAGTAITLAPPTNTARTTSGGNAAGSFNNRLDAWNSVAIDTRDNKVYSVSNGGHGDYYGNEVCTIDMLANAPLWREVLAGSSGNVVRESGDLEQYADLTPPSTHSYYGQFILERHDRALRWGGSVAPSGGAIQPIEGYRIAANAWDGWNGATQDPPYGYSLLGTSAAVFTELAWSMAKHPHTEDFYVLGVGAFRRFRPARVGTGLTMTSLAALPSQVGSGIEGASAIDTTRNRMMWLKGNGGLYSDPITFDLDTGAATLHTFQASAAATALKNMPLGVSINIGSALGMVYVSQIDSYIVRANAVGGRLWKIDAATWAVEYLPETGGGSLPAGAGGNDSSGQQRVYNRLLHVPSIGGLVYFPAGAANAWFYRLGSASRYWLDFTKLAAQDPMSVNSTWSNNTQGVGGNVAPGAGTSMRIVTRTGGGGVIASGSAAHQVNYEDSFAFVPGVIGGALSGPNYRVTATVFRAAGYAPTDNHEIEIIIGCKTGNHPVGGGANYHRWIECLWSVQGSQETIDQNGDFSGGSFTLFGASTGLLSGGPADGDKMVAEYYPAARRVRWGRIRAGVTTWAHDTTNATYINPANLGDGIGLAMFRRSNAAFDTVAASFGFTDITVESFT